MASAAREMIIVVSSNKIVDHLGAFPLPVEVIQFGWQQTGRALANLGCEPALRTRDDGEPYATDNGNYVFDCAFGRIDDPAALEARINLIPGASGNGLFVGMATRVLIAGDDGQVTSIP